MADPPHDAADPGGLTIADATTTPVPRRATPSIPGYEVLHELGRGGMGVVYLARQARLNRPCALKMILAGDQASAESSVKGHTSPITLLAFAPEAAALASGATDGVLKVWDLKSPDGVRTLEASDTSASRLVFSRDGRQLATAGRTIGLWDVRTRAPIRIFGGDGPDQDGPRQSTCLALAPDGTRMATGGRGARVVLWELATGRALRTLEGMPPEFYGPPSPHYALSTPQLKRIVGALAFSPDGTLLAVGYGNRTGFIGDYRQVVRVWDVRTGQDSRVLHVANTVSMLQFSADGVTLRAACHDGTVRSWKVGNWEPAGTLTADEAIASAAIAPDETLLAAGLTNGTIVLWERATGREVRRVNGHPGGVPAMAFTPDGRTLATSSGSDRALKFWDVAIGNELLSLRTQPGRLLGLAFAPGGDLLATGEPDGVRIWPAAPLGQIVVVSGRPAGPSARRSPVGALPADPLP